MNRDPEKDYSNMTDALKFVFDQMLKTVYVSIPGIIDSYNPATKRAVVHPAIRIEKTDGTTLVHESIVNVPVVWPSGGGFTLISPLPQGEPVEILFSQRGITKFKEIFADCDPGIGLFDKEDAYIIPGFGALYITPATEIGISLQSEDGAEYIYIEPAKMSIKSTALVEVECVTLNAAVTGTTNLTCPTVNIDGNLVVTGNIEDVNGTMEEMRGYYNPHTHPGGGVPSPQMT